MDGPYNGDVVFLLSFSASVVRVLVCGRMRGFTFISQRGQT